MISISVRIGKKSKDGESKSQTIEAINRLICTSKSQNQYLKGEWFTYGESKSQTIEAIN